ncbi:DarT1-associated NADAR antitoxin family protein [Cetobacterium sp.]|uniref:DarT1-associated NADAR antitoxin family protein n=1 Tax=Cetobacterium sp. TaxID=2071632 RepID=UPI002FCA63DC
MAEKKYFIANLEKNIIEEKIINYVFKAGLATVNKQENIKRVHTEIVKREKREDILDISSKSLIPLGVELSAFNLSIITKKKKKISVESIFQSSKVFENGNQYIDLLYKTSIEAKKDSRLKNSGKIIGFSYNNINFSNEPQTLFYDWIYINTLCFNIKNCNLNIEEILKYSIFTDIEFYHEKSINCQARSAALFILMYKNGILEECLKDSKVFEKYLKLFYGIKDNKIKEQNENIKLF